MENRLNLRQIKFSVLGSGAFAQPTINLFDRYFKVVEPEQADCLIVANYGKILSSYELKRPKFGVINLHPSLLPLFRGPTPIQTAIAQGERETGLTIIKIDKKIDHGPIITQKNYQLKKTDTTEILMDKLGNLGAEMLKEILEKYLNGEIKPRRQDHSQATYTKKLTLSNAFIELTGDPVKKYNFIRAYAKEPGVFLRLKDGEELKIISAKLSEGKLVPTLIQRPGKRIIPFEDFKRGYRKPINLGL